MLSLATCPLSKSTIARLFYLKRNGKMKDPQKPKFEYERFSLSKWFIWQNRSDHTQMKMLRNLIVTMDPKYTLEH